MLIKNNKIIARKCKERLFEDVLEKRGYQKLLVDGKTLIVPFHVFNEDDLFADLESANVNYYAVPLFDEHYHSLIVNGSKIMCTFNVIEKGVFEKEANFTNTVELIRLLSYQCENPKNCTYDKLLKELKVVVKNPVSDYININLSTVGKYLIENLDVLHEREQELIESLEKGLQDDEVRYKAVHGEEFLKACLLKFVYEPILNAYVKSDFVFWYNTLSPCSRGNYENIINC